MKLKTLLAISLLALVCSLGFGEDKNYIEIELSTKTFTCLFCGDTTSYLYNPLTIGWYLAPEWLGSTWSYNWYLFDVKMTCHIKCGQKVLKWFCELYKERDYIVKISTDSTKSEFEIEKQWYMYWDWKLKNTGAYKK